MFTREIGRYQEYKRGLADYGAWFSPALEIYDSAMTVSTGLGTGIADAQAIAKGAESKRF